MLFWLFMLAADLIIPVTMIVISRAYLHHPPEHISMDHGYRSTRSMKNEDTWRFAHQYGGKWWLWVGAILLPVSAAAMIPFARSDIKTTGIAGGVACGVQLIVLLLSFAPVEWALKRNFDENGIRRR